MIKHYAKEQCRLESKDYFLIKHKDRIKLLGEVFTPTELVLEILNQLPGDDKQTINKIGLGTGVWEPGKTYLDPTCGNGQFLAAVLIIKMNLNHINPLSTIYGVDIMKDNCIDTIERLYTISGINFDKNKLKAIPKDQAPENYKDEDGLIAIFEYDGKIIKNIVQADGLLYEYNFGEETGPNGKVKGAIAPKKEKVIVEDIKNTVLESPLFRQ